AAKTTAKPVGKRAAPQAAGLSPRGLQAALADPLQATPAQIAQLQRQYGNQAVQRLMQPPPANAVQREPMGPEGGELDQSLQSQINSARGGGQPLDKQVGTRLGSALGADFSGVRVHTDSQADTLNRSISARAFTI